MLGYRIYRSLSVVATGQLVKGAPGKLFGYDIHNNAAAIRFVKFYDKASAPTVGTDTPVMTIQLAAAGHVIMSPSEVNMGIDFVNGIGIGATNLIGDADTTAPTANDIVVNLMYR